MPRTRRESDAEASSIELDQPGAQIDLELGLRRREETELPLEEVMRELKKEAKKKAEEATRKREEAGRVLEEIGREVEELERKYEEAKKKKTEKKKREREEAKREAEKAARQLIQEERQLQERGIRLWTPVNMLSITSTSINELLPDPAEFFIDLLATGIHGFIWYGGIFCAISQKPLPELFLYFAQSR
jgi:hypothetical protein